MVKPSKKAASPQRQPYTPQATPAIKLLMDAWHCAADIGSDPARFPVPIGELQEAGMPGHEIQWAADKRYVEVIVLPCCPYSGLLLTDKGVEYFEPLASGIAPAEPAVKVIDIRPDWNIDLRKLKVGERLVKQFHRPAPVQELVMAALEEDDWIRRIDDPLLP